MLNQNTHNSATPNKQFDPLKFIIEFGGIQIMRAAYRCIGDHHPADVILDNKEIDLLDDAAEAAMVHEVWDCSAFLKLYPGTRLFFEEAAERMEWKLQTDRLRRPGAIGKVTVYCQRGCNQIDVCAEEPWDCCAACGQIMTTGSEDSYYHGLVLAGHAI